MRFTKRALWFALKQKTRKLQQQKNAQSLNRLVIIRPSPSRSEASAKKGTEEKNQWKKAGVIWDWDLDVTSHQMLGTAHPGLKLI